MLDCSLVRQEKHVEINFLKSHNNNAFQKKHSHFRKVRCSYFLDLTQLLYTFVIICTDFHFLNILKDYEVSMTTKKVNCVKSHKLQIKAELTFYFGFTLYMCLNVIVSIQFRKCVLSSTVIVILYLEYNIEWQLAHVMNAIYCHKIYIFVVYY